MTRYRETPNGAGPACSEPACPKPVNTIPDRADHVSSGRTSLFNRRDLLLSARNGGLFLVFTPAALLPRAVAEDTALDHSARATQSSVALQGPSTAEEVVRRLLRGAKPIEGKVKIDMAEIAENGNIVPFTITADSPMTDTDFVKSIHIVCSGNAQPHIASFHFTALSGQASVTSRLRLAKTQDLLVLVEHSTGQFVLAQRTVKVSIGGCGGT
jgi:sulfur-oxidizing protein SoxY